MNEGNGKKPGRKSYSVTPMTAAEKAALDKQKSKIPGSGSANQKPPDNKDYEEKSVGVVDKPDEINFMTLFNLLQESIKINAINHKSLEVKIYAVAKVENKLEEVKTQTLEIKGLVTEMEAKFDSNRIDMIEESVKSAMALAENNNENIERMKEREEDYRNEVTTLARMKTKPDEFENMIKEREVIQPLGRRMARGKTIRTEIDQVKKELFLDIPSMWNQNPTNTKNQRGMQEVMKTLIESHSPI